MRTGKRAPEVNLEMTPWRFGNTGRLPNARSSRASVPFARTAPTSFLLHWLYPGLIVGLTILAGCKEQTASDRSPNADPRALVEQATLEFHNASADAQGAERDRLLSEAAARYAGIVKRFPQHEDVAAQALRGLGSVYAAQGKLDEAVKHYRQTGEKYPGRDWEVLQAWKAAGDLLWEADRREEAKTFYSRIVERFGDSDEPAIIQTVVRGSKSRLSE